jgi:hypothetical protein
VTSRIHAHGRYILTAERGGTLLWQIAQNNFITDAGLSYMAGAALAGDAVRTAWYIGIKGGYTDALPNETLASKSWPEIDPGSGVRPLWSPARTPGTPGFLSNAVAPAVIHFTQDAEVSGVFLVGGSVVGSTTDLLFSVADWLTEQEMRVGDTITITYQMSLEAADV